MEGFGIKAHQIESTCAALSKNMIRVENKISKNSARGDKFLKPGL